LEQTPEKIKTITIPTLILWGEKDLLIDVSNASLFNKAITGSKMVIFPNIGHVAMEEAPKKVADEMMEW
jgi:pimeloyl-ACP methyl ester carboxylesterase